MPFTIETLPISEFPALGEEWPRLEARAQNSAFLAWPWIGTLVATSPAPLSLLRISEGSEIVALAVLGARNVRRFGLIAAKQLCLNESGNAGLDRITVEYNGLLTRAATSGALLHAVVQDALAGDKICDELVLGGISATDVEALRGSGFPIEIDRRAPSFRVGLEAMRTKGQQHLDCVSSNTRAQIRQAIRAFSEIGPLSIRAAGDAAEALNFLDELCKLHEVRWRHKGAFSTPETAAFHRNLVRRGTETGFVELLKVSAGPQLVGYLYNLKYRGSVLNYQSGFAYRSDNRLRAGLVAHHLAIERALDQGALVYDLLAGRSRYKESLAHEGPELFWCRVQSPALRFRLERLARRVRGALRRG